MKTALILLLAVSASLLAQDDDFQTIRTDVNLVQIDAQVLQKKTGRPVGTLAKEDFLLEEDGVSQHIAQLSRDQLPLSVVLLFDLTLSVQPVLKPLAAGALEALNHLKPEDEVAVMVYADKTHLLQDFTTDRALAVSAIRRASEMQSGADAFFNQAIYEASDQLLRAHSPQSRRTIIWLTDNVPNVPSSAQHSEQEAFHKLLETSAVVSVLLERSGVSDFFMVTYTKNPVFAPLRHSHPPGDAYKYAARTGGEVMRSRKEDVATKLAQLIDSIRTRYTIGYYPSVKKEKGTFCRIKLDVGVVTKKREGQLLVRTKTGYYR